MPSIRLIMVAPSRDRCGITDYTGYLIDALRSRVDVKGVIDPRHYRSDTFDSDILHVQHQYFLFGGVAPWRNRFGTFIRSVRVPAVATVHEFVTPTGPPHVRAAIRLTNRVQFGSRRLRRLLVHTESDRGRLTESGFDTRSIELVRHGVPARPALPDKESAKRELGLEGRFVVTLFGFLSRRKGHGIVIEAMRDSPPESTLLIAGGRHPDDTSEYAKLLETQIASAHLAERARITGYLAPAEIARVMAATDLVIAPFTESSGSGSLAMAFACGKAVLASDIGPHREILQEQASSLRLIRSEPEAWGAGIAWAMRSPEERETLEAGAAAYAAHHTYDRMADETTTVYRRVLEESAR